MHSCRSFTRNKPHITRLTASYLNEPLYTTLLLIRSNSSYYWSSSCSSQKKMWTDFFLFFFFFFGGGGEMQGPDKALGNGPVWAIIITIVNMMITSLICCSQMGLLKFMWNLYWILVLQVIATAIFFSYFFGRQKWEWFIVYSYHYQ